MCKLEKYRCKVLKGLRSHGISAELVPFAFSARVRLPRVDVTFENCLSLSAQSHECPHHPAHKSLECKRSGSLQN